MRSHQDILLELKKIMEPAEGQDDPKTAPMPEMADVLYVGPAPGGVRRRCANCVFWASAQELCALLEPKEEVIAANICGMHVFGSPQKTKMDLPGLQTLQPRFVGLSKTEKGSACENCEWFSADEDDSGTCVAVMRKKKPAAVSPKGCCTRWKQQSGPPTDPKDD
jgi:hypothetical protein